MRGSWRAVVGIMSSISGMHQTPRVVTVLATQQRGMGSKGRGRPSHAKSSGRGRGNFWEPVQDRERAPTEQWEFSNRDRSDRSSGGGWKAEPERGAPNRLGEREAKGTNRLAERESGGSSRWAERESGGREWRGEREGAGRERRGGGGGGRGRRDNQRERPPRRQGGLFPTTPDRSGSNSGGGRRDEWDGGESFDAADDRTAYGDDADEYADFAVPTSRGGGGAAAPEQWRSRERRPPAGPTLRDTWVADVLYGVSPVLAALEAGRRQVHCLYLQEGMDVAKRKDKSAVDAAAARARQLGAEVRYASKHDLNMVAENRPHQGLVLDASPLDFEAMDAFPHAANVWEERVAGGTGAAGVLGSSAEEERGGGGGQGPPVWLCLDEVMDPQNFGAALRSAFFLGAAGVLTCRRNSAPLSGVVSKASAGAMELAPVHSCRSLPQTLADAREKGWAVVGAAAEEGAVPAAHFRVTQPTILVMGNEGYGLRTTVKSLCHTTLRIDGAPGATGQGVGAAARQGRAMVDSLNVSVATGILLHQLLAPKPE